MGNEPLLRGRLRGLVAQNFRDSSSHHLCPSRASARDVRSAGRRFPTVFSRQTLAGTARETPAPHSRRPGRGPWPAPRADWPGVSRFCVFDVH